VLLGGASLPQGVEKEIEERVREVCIENCFSTCEEVRYISPSLAFIDFPYHEACRDFLRVTGATLKVHGRSYKLQHSSNAPPAAPTASDREETTAADGTPLDHPTDTLMVRQIGDMGEAQVMKAFRQVVPTVKSCRLLLDRRTRKSKGFCFVSFWSVSEAETALARFHAAGSLIEGRKVSISFAKPQTHEQMLESDMCYRNEQHTIQAQAQQALGGINADMWASYLQMFNEEKEREDAAKAAAKVEQDVAASPPEAALALTDSRDAGAPPLAGMGNEVKALKPPTPMGTMVVGGLGMGQGSSGTLVPDSAASMGGATAKAPSPCSAPSPQAGGIGRGQPGMGGLSNLPAMPGGMTGMPSMPSMPGMPGMAGMPGMPSMQGMQGTLPGPMGSPVAPLGGPMGSPGANNLGPMSPMGAPGSNLGGGPMGAPSGPSLGGPMGMPAMGSAPGSMPGAQSGVMPGMPGMQGGVPGLGGKGMGPGPSGALPGMPAMPGMPCLMPGQLPTAPVGP